MSYTFVIVVFAAILVFALYSKFWKKGNKNKTKRVEGQGVPEMEKIFLDRVSAGSDMYAIASVYGKYDIMTLKSLLQSEQIPYYFEFENTSKTLIGIPPATNNATIIKVLDKDYDDALLVLNKYVKNKVEAEGEAAVTDTIEIFKKT